MSLECEHGQLARSCNICEYEREIAELNARVGEQQTEREYGDILAEKDSTIKALVSLCLSNGIISRGLACQYLGCGREELDEILDKVATKEKGGKEDGDDSV